MESLPTDQYQTKSPSPSELMDTIRDNARNLSDAIKAANKAGISVSIMQLDTQTPEEVLFNVVYSF